jgi:hypothetical protein
MAFKRFCADCDAFEEGAVKDRAFLKRIYDYLLRLACSSGACWKL